MTEMQPRSAIARLADGRWGPTRLALALGVVAIPIVAAALTIPEWAGLSEASPPDLVGAIVIATIASLGAALVGGWLGGRLRGRAMLSPLAAIAAAWLVGTTLLAAGPWLLGLHFETGFLCVDGCFPQVTSANPISGATAWGIGMLFGGLLLVPLVIAGVLLLIARAMMRRDHIVAGTIIVVLAYGTFWGLGMLDSLPNSIVIYACLAAGVVAWTVLLRRVEVDAPALPRPGADQASSGAESSSPTA